MSIFENLIEELKREHLLEEGVIETNSPAVDEPYLFSEMPVDQPKNSVTAENPAASAAAENLAGEEKSDMASELSALNHVFAEPESPVNETEFYRRRAMEEVASLQMVEHIISGVEREQLKIVPNSYDNIAVSQALHEFLKVSKSFHSPENASAEFTLMQETESWYTTLSTRDRNILPVQLRRYCESTRPVLSAQALASLARFYRNSPYSESIRSKFDMVITRLFSQEVAGDERELAFGYNEITQHLSELYADWASISLYATDDDSEIRAIVQNFDNFITEAESAKSFEELVKSDFFNRLRSYKEKTGENFYAPSVAATVIDCNVRVGNVYVKLVSAEREQSNAAHLEGKYNHLLDQTISEATSKTLRLIGLLEGKRERQFDFEEPEKKSVDDKSETPVEVKEADTVKQPDNLLTRLLQVNKFILAATLLTIFLSGGLYFWSEISQPPISQEGVETFQLDGYYFKDYLKSAKITNENLIGIVTVGWDGITQEKKQEILKNILVVGKEKGFRTVRLQNNQGQTIGYASEDSITASNSNQN